MVLVLSGRKCEGLAGRIELSSTPSSIPPSFSAAAAAAVAAPTSLSLKGGGMGKAAISSAVWLVRLFIGDGLLPVSEEEEEEEDRG